MNQTRPAIDYLNVISALVNLPADKVIELAVAMYVTETWGTFKPILDKQALLRGLTPDALFDQLAAPDSPQSPQSE